MYVRKRTRRYQPRPRRWVRMPDGRLLKLSPRELESYGLRVADEDPTPEAVYVSYAVVESYRDEQGRPRQRQVADLGPHPTVEAKLAHLRERCGELAAKVKAPRGRIGGELAALRRLSLESNSAEIERLEQIAARMSTKRTRDT